MRKRRQRERAQQAALEAEALANNTWVRFTIAQRTSFAQTVAAFMFSEMTNSANRGALWTPDAMPEIVRRAVAAQAGMARMAPKYRNGTAKLAVDFYMKFLDGAMRALCPNMPKVEPKRPIDPQIARIATGKASMEVAAQRSLDKIKMIRDAAREAVRRAQ